MAIPKTARAKLLLLERRHLAMTLRKAGHTYKTIAERVTQHFERHYSLDDLPNTYGKRQVFEDVVACIQEIRDELTMQTHEVVELELQRIDELMTSLWPRAMGRPAKYATNDDGTHQLDDDGRPILLRAEQEPDTQAHRRIVELMERRAKLLGLDAPESFRVTGDPTKPLTVKVLRGVSMDDL